MSFSWLQTLLPLKLLLTPWTQLVIVISTLPFYFSRSVQVRRADNSYESLSLWIGDRCANTRHQNARLTLRGFVYEMSPDHWDLFWYQGWPYLCQRSIRRVGHVTEDVLRIWTVGQSQRALHDLMEAVHQKSQTRQDDVDIYLATFEYGRFDWKKACSQPRRSIESIDMDLAKKAQVVDDIRKFFSNQEKYARLHQPHRRGYLFYGPPGTGKTSLASAVPAALQDVRMDIYMLSIRHKQMSDYALLDLFTKLPPNALVLLEDVDALGISDENRQEGTTLSAILTALDGTISTSGRVVIMSTNKIDAIDERILRPGRIDMRVEFPLATPAIAQAMHERWYTGDVGAEDLERLSKKFASLIPSGEIAPAAIANYLKTHIDSAHNAVSQIATLLEQQARIVHQSQQR